MSRTRNEKTSLPFDLGTDALDNIMDFDDEFDFDNKRNKDRSPVMSGLKGVGKGVVDHFASMSTIKSLARRILPEGYSTAIDMADDLHSSTHELYDYARKYVRNDVKEFKQSLGRFMTRQDSDPESSSHKYGKKLLDQFKSKDYQGDTEESAVAITMAKISVNEGQREAAREKRQDIRHSIDSSIQGKRFEDSMGVMVGIHNNLNKIVSYNDTYDAAVKRQTLDTSLRQLIVARKTYDLIKGSTERNVKLLEDIQHNTGLPDAVKLHKKEQAGLMLREYMLNKMGQNAKSFVGSMGKGVKENFKRAFTDTLDIFTGALSTASMGLDMATDAAEFAEELEGGKAGMAGQVFGTWLGDIIGEKVVNPLREKAEKNKTVRSVGQALGRSKNIPQFLMDYFNSKERDRDEFADDNFDDMGNEKFGSVLKRMGVAFGRDVFKAYKRDDTVRTEADAAELSKSAVWNNRDHIALTQIIPGLVARVHGEIRAMRTNSDPTYIQFDIETGLFKETASITKNIVDRMYGSDQAKEIRGKAHGVIDQIDPNKKLDKATRDKLAAFLTKRASEGKGFHVQDLMKAESYGNEFDNKERGRIAGMVRGRFHKPMNKDNFKDILLDEDYQKKMTGLSNSYEGLAKTVPNIQNDLVKEIMKGNLDALVDTGLVEFKDGKWVARVDDIHNNMLKGMGGNEGGQAGGYGIRRNKRFHLPSHRGRNGRSLIERTVQQTKTFNPTTSNRDFQENIEGNLALTRRIEELSNNIIEAIVKGYTTVDAKRSAEALDAIKLTLEEIKNKEFSSTVNITRNKNTMNNKMTNIGQNIIGGVRGRMDSFQTMINEELGKRGINDSTIAAVLGAAISVSARAFAVGSKFKDFIFDKLEKAHEIGKKGLKFGLGKIQEHGPGIINKLGKAVGGAYDYAFEEAKDVYLKGVQDPIMTATGFHNGEYFDGETGDPLKNHKGIRGEVRDKKNNVVLTLQQFAEVGIFTLDGKSRFDQWRDAAKNKLASIRKGLVEGGGVAKKHIFAIAKNVYEEVRFYSDVYVGGESTPRLFKFILQNGGYSQKATGKVVSSYDDLISDIVDSTGNVRLSADDIAKGLMDNKGKRLRSLHTRLFDAVRGAKAKVKAFGTKVKGFGSSLLKGARKLKNRLFGLSDEGVDSVGGEDVGKLSGARLQNRMLREVIMIRSLLQKGKRKGKGGKGGFFGLGGGEDAGANEGESSSETGEKKPGMLSRMKGFFSRKNAAGEDENRKGGFAEWRKRRAAEKAAKANFVGPVQPKRGGGVMRFLMGLIKFAPLVMAVGGFLLAPILKPLSLLTTVLGFLGKGLGKLGLLTGAGAAIGGLVGGKTGAAIGGALGASVSVFGAGKTAKGVFTAAKWGFRALRLIPLLFNPYVLGAVAVLGLLWVGYKAFKYFTAKDNFYTKSRFAEYGVDVTDEKKAEAIANLEKVCSENLIFPTSGGAASLKESGIPLKDIVKKFGISEDNDEKQEEWVKWYAERFKPVFLSHITIMKDITGDSNLMDSETRLTAKQKIEVMNRVQFPYAGSGPYSKGWSPWGDASPIKYGPVEVQTIRKVCIEGLSDEMAKGEKSDANSTTKESKAKQQKLTKDTKSYWEGKGVAPWEKTPDDKLTPEDKAKKAAQEAAALKAQGGGAIQSIKNAFNGLTTGVADMFSPNYSPNALGATGQTITQPGNGTGGNINALPMPTGTKGIESMGPLIVAAAKMVGVDPSLLLTMANIESGFDSQIKAPGGTATGLFQFVKDTWKGMLAQHAGVYGIDGRTPPTDARANALMGAEYAKYSYNYLKKKLGRTPTDTDVYMAHFLGPGTAAPFLKADANAIAAERLPKEAAANIPIFYDKGRPRTVQEVVNFMDSKIKGKRVDVSKVSGVPATLGPVKENPLFSSSPSSTTQPVTAPVSTAASKSPISLVVKPNAFVAAPVTPGASVPSVVPTRPTVTPVASQPSSGGSSGGIDITPLAKATDNANKTAAATLGVQKGQSSSLESIDSKIGQLLDVMKNQKQGAPLAPPPTVPRQTNVVENKSTQKIPGTRENPTSFFETRI